MRYINKAMAYDILASNKRQYEETIKKHIDTMLKDNEPQWKKIVDHMYMEGALPPAFFQRANEDFLVVGVTSLCPSTGERLYFPIAARLASRHDLTSRRGKNFKRLSLGDALPLPYYPLFFKRPNMLMDTLMGTISRRWLTIRGIIRDGGGTMGREEALLGKPYGVVPIHELEKDLKDIAPISKSCVSRRDTIAEAESATFYMMLIPVKQVYETPKDRYFMEATLFNAKRRIICNADKFKRGFNLGFPDDAHYRAMALQTPGFADTDWRYPEERIYSGFCSTVGEGFPADPIIRYKSVAAQLFKGNNSLDNKIARNGYYGVDYDYPDPWLLKGNAKKSITVGDQSEEKAREEKEVLTMWHCALQALLYEKLVFAMPHEIFLMHRMAVDAARDLPLY